MNPLQMMKPVCGQPPAANAFVQKQLSSKRISVVYRSSGKDPTATRDLLVDTCRHTRRDEAVLRATR
jgi:hypothetical protein